MADELRYDILVREQMTEAATRMARAMDVMASQVKKLETDLHGLRNAETETEGSTRKLGTVSAESGGILETFRGKLAGLATGVATFAAGAAAAGTAALAGLGVMGIKAAADNESAMVSFTQMLGGAKQAKDFLAQLAAFAEKTPFELPGLRDSASQLLAVGVRAKDVIPLMTQLGNATAATGTGADGLSRAILALGQTMLAGKVNAEDLIQLSQDGVPALQALAAHLHKTTAQVQDLVSKGKIKPSDLFGALEEGAGPLQKFNGMMDKESATLLGKMSNLKDGLNNTLGKAFEPALGPLKKIVDWLGNEIPRAINATLGYFGRLANVFKGTDVASKLTESLRELGSKVLPVLHSAFNQIANTVEKNKDGLVKLGHFIANDVIPNIGVGLVVAIYAAKWAIEATIIVVAHLVDSFQYARHLIAGAVTYIVDTILAAYGMIVNGAASAFGWIPGIGPKLREAAGKFNEWVGAVNRTLADIDGRTVHVYIQGAAYIPAVPGSSSTTGHSAIKAMASGGTFGPGDVATVGENGRETVIFGRSGMVIPNGAGLAMAGAGNNYNINVSVAAGANPADTGREIVKAIKKYEQVNGAGWRG